MLLQSNTPKYLLTRPDLPLPEDWVDYMKPAYAKNWFSNFGPVSRLLERRLAQKWGFDGSSFVMTSSGTAAIAAPLIANGVSGPVVCPAFTFAGTYSAIQMSGGQPVVVDVELNDWQISPENLDMALARTGAKCAVLVSPFGISQDFAALLAVAKRRNAMVVIDSAAGLGNARQPVEENGLVYEAYSLHATKPFGVGEGGLIVSHSSKEPDIRSALNFGIQNVDADGEPRWGINGKMSELNAAVGLAVLDSFDERMKRRHTLVKMYADLLSTYPQVAFWPDLDTSTWQVFPMLLPTQWAAETLISHARDAGMEVRRYYRPSLSALPYVEALDRCPNSESLAQRMCCVPVYSNATHEEIIEMTGILAAALGEALDQTV